MRRRRSHRARKRLGGGAPMLKITALMDIFSTLLLFLLKSFVADGQSGTVTPGVTLPSSVSQSALWDAPVIAVTDRFISLEGEVMAESGKALAGTDLRVEPLYRALVELREQNAQHPDFKPRLVVQGDRNIEFRLLQRVMYTGQIAGFTDVSLAVIHDEATPEVALGGETDS